MKRHPSILWKNKDKPLFTFDDGPGIDSIQFAELLAKQNRSGIFFLIGEHYDREIVKEILNMGHEIGWHSQTHRNFRSLSAEEIQHEIESRKEIEDDLGVPFIFFRFPYGYFRKKYIQPIEKQGLKIMMWTFKCDDYKPRSVDELLTSLRKIRNDDIVLLHDKSKNSKNTLDAFRHYLKEIPC